MSAPGGVIAMDTTSDPVLWPQQLCCKGSCHKPCHKINWKLSVWACSDSNGIAAWLSPTQSGMTTSLMRNLMTYGIIRSGNNVTTHFTPSV